ncbi:catalase [Stella humosa]|uniref:Catalase n=1 Tax=Stella humosa TaxID=94 RepID=A0A3N1M595_9PROT|nr:catalase [Stella humosa]ROQ00962.1 catalase [Stella humosa]BBK31329.1 catalase [Stella humosa]
MARATKGGTPPSSNSTAPELGQTAAERGAPSITTNQGVVIADNRNSLKAGPRGPTLLEDFILREKITHFDHERIPERIVHARGSGAHGYFRPYKSWASITKAHFLQDPKRKTPVFVRFSTVAGGAGSNDTVRDVRGFAVKFYTQEGNYDLVGNNIPVFFIQDAMRFPDLIHAVKPEPDREFPQASSAHDTFWDFASLMPESLHMLMWAMSDRGIPRSYRMMEGFGIHTFRFIDQAGTSRFVKFHWRPKLGSFSLVWDEAVKIAGADPDFHRRDLWDAIDQGKFPAFELSVQIFDEEMAAGFPFDVLDSTKLIPEELVPLTPLGEMVLDRNPDNFFAETEQVAFHPGHVVPGIDLSNDPLLQGRLFSYLDTQLSRLGSSNFHQIPVNQPKCPFANLQRGGHMRMSVEKGRVAYEPNSLDMTAPVQDPDRGYKHHPEAMESPKIRIRPESFADHHSQARLFWKSQTDTERTHIVAAFRFELSKVDVAAVRERMVGHLFDVDAELGGRVAAALGMPARQADMAGGGEAQPSPALSLLKKARETLETRKIGCLVADGVSADLVDQFRRAVERKGGKLMIVSMKRGGFQSAEGPVVPADFFVQGGPSILFDAVVLLGGSQPPAAFLMDAAAKHFAADAFAHLKTIAADDGGVALLAKAGIGQADFDEAVVPLSAKVTPAAISRFVASAARHRLWSREAKVSAPV